MAPQHPYAPPPPQQAPPPPQMWGQAPPPPHQAAYYGAPPAAAPVPAAAPPAGPNEVRTLWIGDLQYWIDENYIDGCFAATGEVRVSPFPSAESACRSLRSVPCGAR